MTIEFSDLLTYVGFNLAIFAFLSQYLMFPKDILSELHRTRREDELPANGAQITTERDEEKSSDKIKAFFLEHDTITFVTLSYIIISIVIVLLLMIKSLRPEQNNNQSFQILLIIISLGYGILMVIITLMAWNNRLRDWPERYKIFKYFYLGFINIVTLSISITIAIFTICCKFDYLFFAIIFGLLIHFIIYILILAIRNPISTLLSLWEPLQASAANSIKSPPNEIKEKE